MDKELDVDINEKELNPKPEYITMDRKDREAYLSQIGNFTTEERGIFNLLCDNWEPEIGYAKFVTRVNKKHPIDDRYLHTLMKKLRSSGSGILTTKYVRGERGVDKLILTEVRNHFFYYYFINNEYQKNYEEVTNDYVDNTNFDRYEIITNELSPLTLNLDQLNNNFIKTEQHRSNVYIVKLEGFRSFYITSESLQDLIKLSVRKVKYYFKSDNFIAFIAKLMNISISKLRTTVDNFEISAWRGLSLEILKNRKLINSKFKNISDSFFKAIVILNNYCISELAYKDKELEDERKLKETLREIAHIIREKEFTPFSQEAFNELFESYKDAPEIKSKFYEHFVDNKTKTGLTDIVFIGKCYVHQDNLYKVFLDQVGLATAQLHETFVMEYKRCIHSNSQDPSLLEGLPFESSILSRLEAEFPIVYDLLNRKSILAEAIIHFSKKRGHSQGKMHNLLSMYFIEGKNELRRLYSIFSLHPVELFEEAYSSLGAFNRFLIFITGRYPRYVERFTGHKKRKKQKVKPVSQGSRSGYSGNASQGSHSYGDYTGGGYSGGHRSGKSLLKGETAKPKRKKYNKDEIDDAWSNLGAELTKKKRT